MGDARWVGDRHCQVPGARLHQQLWNSLGSNPRALPFRPQHARASAAPLPAVLLCRAEAPCPRGTFSNREGMRLCAPW